MRNNRLWLVAALAVLLSAGSGCAVQRCVEEYSTMPMNQVIHNDGELLHQLVEKRRAAAEELEQVEEGSSARGELELSIQAWEMAIRLVVQLQNLSRDEENATALEEQRELTSNIRCLAQSWASGRGHRVSAREGRTMLSYQRELESHFGERGRPTDNQLSAIIEGREIYMGPVEEDVDVPETDEGTGPGAEEHADESEGNEANEAASSAIDDLLGDE